jgi:hypothetical protein
LIVTRTEALFEQPDTEFVSVTVTVDDNVAPGAGLFHLTVRAFVPEPLRIVALPSDHEYVLPALFVVLYVCVELPQTFVAPVMIGAGGLTTVTF